MIDTIAFINGISGSSYDLNTVTNGVGCALKSFQAGIDEMRHSSQDLPYSPGIVQSPTSHGRMVVEVEGDIMGTTATGYWTQRMNMLAQFIAPYPVDTLGEFRLQLTGQSEQWALDASLIGPPVIPVGLAGATISTWRLVLGGNDPWFRGVTQQSQNMAPNTNVALTNFGGGNAPSWPKFTITGPITNPTILWQGSTYIQLTYALTAGNTITIDMRNRIVTGPGGINLWTAIVQQQVWLPIDPRTVGGLGKNFRMNGTSTTGATQLNVQYYNSFVI